MMVRPPEDFKTLTSGAPRGLKLVYDEQLCAQELGVDSPNLPEALDAMKTEVKQLGIDQRGKSQWPQVMIFVIIPISPAFDFYY